MESCYEILIEISQHFKPFKKNRFQPNTIPFSPHTFFQNFVPLCSSGYICDLSVEYASDICIFRHGLSADTSLNLPPNIPWALTFPSIPSSMLNQAIKLLLKLCTINHPLSRSFNHLVALGWTLSNLSIFMVTRHQVGIAVCYGGLRHGRNIRIGPFISIMALHIHRAQS